MSTVTAQVIENSLKQCMDNGGLIVIQEQAVLPMLNSKNNSDIF